MNTSYLELLQRRVRWLMLGAVLTGGALASGCDSVSAPGLSAPAPADAGPPPADARTRERPAAPDAAEPTQPDLDAQVQGDLDGGDPPQTAVPDRRGFLLAASEAQLRVEGRDLGLRLLPAALAPEVDVAVVHQEFYGIPWEAFADGEAPLQEWEQTLAALAEAAQADSSAGVFVSISPLDGTRNGLAPRTVLTAGRVDSEAGWAQPCYDFASATDAARWRAAYLSYVEYMVRVFRPRYLVNGIEVNLFFEHCPQAASGLVDVLNEAYAAAKRIDPQLAVFPSVQIDHLYGLASGSCAAGTTGDECFEHNYQALAGLKRDRFAMSSYPFLAGVTDPDELPDDWFSRAAAVVGERALIAETGWSSADAVALWDTAECRTAFRSDTERAARYLRRVLADAERLDLELVSWWSSRDLLPLELMTDCPCSLDSDWCAVVDLFRAAQGDMPNGGFYGEVLLKAFGAMGLRDYDGAPKSELLEPWQAAFARPR